MNFKKIIVFSTIFCLFSCGTNVNPKEEENNVDYGTPSIFNDNYIHYFGRCYNNNSKKVEMHFSGTGFEFKINAKENKNKLSLSLQSTISNSYTSQFVGIYIDDVLSEKKELNNSTFDLNIANDLAIGNHYIKLVKLNERNVGSLYLNDISFEGCEFSLFDKNYQKRIEFYGDSITCGYGVLGNTQSGFEPITEDATYAYPYLTASELGYDYSIVSASGISLAMNAFNSDYYFKHLYPTYDGTNDYDLKHFNVDIAVINLGTNDNTKLITYSGTQKENMATAFYNEYLSLALKIKENNPDCKFLLCYDMMTQFDGFLVTAIDGVYNYLNTEFDECAYTLQFKIDYGGSDGHPGKIAHQNNASIIANFIKENMCEE